MNNQRRFTLGELRRPQPPGEKSDVVVDEDYTKVITGLSEWAQERLKGTELVRTVDEKGNALVRYEMKQHPLAVAQEEKPSRGWITGMAVAGDKLLIADIQTPQLLLEPHTPWAPEDPNFKWCAHCLDVSGGHSPNCALFPLGWPPPPATPTLDQINAAFDAAAKAEDTND